MPLQVVIADEHPLFRDALTLVVTRAFVGAFVTEADSAASLFEALDRNREADLVLLDLDLPDTPGCSALVQLRVTFPAVPVVIISGRKEPGIVARAVAHGAAGFVPKSAPAATVIEALRCVLAGGVWVPTHFSALDHHYAGSGALLEVAEFESASLVSRLTPQQFRVLQMLCSGLPNKQIGLRLNVTEATVKAHMRAIMEKFGANNRTQVVLAARPGLSRRALARPGEQHSAQRHGEADELQRQQRFMKEEIRLDRG
jgi:DNA-binding NarL/FixJ family response regulator